MKNKLIARLFEEMADLLEIKEVQWKPRAYRVAAQTLESMSEDISELARQDKLMDLPGIGEHMADKIKEFLKTGKIKELEDLRKKTPIKVEELRGVEGIGPKTIKKLYQKLKVKSLHDLEMAARKGLIQKVEGLGKKTQDNILDAIGFRKSSGDRVLYAHALSVADEVMAHLSQHADIDEISVAGSLRRAKSTIGDVDILVASKRSSAVMEALSGFKDVKKVLAKGDTKSSVMLDNKMQVDVRVLPKEQWGAALLYFTGSKMHNIALRKIAIEKGLKLNEYGLFRTDRVVAQKTESDIYKSLGLSYIPPEIREDTGEIQAAQKGKIPPLIQVKDLKGDFHMHTTASDGTASIEQMARSAKAFGLSYCVITDHTGQLQIAGGLRGKDLMDHIKKIRRVAEKTKGFTILAGAEANITEQGELDIDTAALNRLDLTIGSVHSGFKNTKEKMTKRICTALEHPRMHILGHPTGRLINRRPSYEFDVEKVFAQAKRTGTALELDAQPYRFDLPTSLLRKAKENDLTISISSDAHAPDQIRYLEYGVAHARRAWLEPKDTLNVRSAKEILSWAKKKQGP